MKKIYLSLLFAAATAVAANAQIATFEDITIGEEDHMSVSTEDDDDRTEFTSGSYTFATGCMHDYSYWYWFGYANQKENTYKKLDDQWRNIVGGGYNGSSNYGVAFCAEFNGPCYVTVSGDEGAVVPGFYITNSAYAYTSMLNGDGFAKKFGVGDWFKLTITGFNANDEKTGTKEYYLADLRDADTTKHYILDTWKWVDLSSLGEVKSLRFDLSSSDVGQWGMNTPAYVCIDNLGCAKPMGDVNCDGFTSIADVTALIDYLLGSDVNPFDSDAADVNRDGTISISDVTSLIDYLLSLN
jgi:hypothetical protein